MKHKLSDAQMKELKKAVIDKTPDQLKFDFAPWSSKAIREYVRREYGMSISRRTARRYMQKMGFTYQCPVKAAREQNPALVRKWLETDYPAIRKEAAESGSAICWADESSVLTCETTERGRGGCRGPRFESVGGPIRTRSPCGCRDGRERPPPCCRRTATSSTS